MKLTIRVDRRPSTDLWGRFDWKLGFFGGELGFQAGGKTLIVSLLTFSIIFDWEKKK
jgi:hypothetical protein